MNQSIDQPTDSGSPGVVPQSPRDGIWASLIGVAFVASMALAYRPAFGSAAEVGRAIVPWLLLGGLVLAWSGRVPASRLTGITIALVGWFFLAVADDRWTLLSFALYGLCFIVDSNRLEQPAETIEALAGSTPTRAFS